jgi:predicted secreted protein with PEFG-CTERM motif
LSYICKSCNKASIYITDLSSGEVLCPHCGAVIIEKFSESADFGKNGYVLDFAVGNKEFGNYSVADMGLSSIMDPSGRDAHGVSLSSNSKESFRRLAIWDKKSRPKKIRGMHIPLTVLQNISGKLGLPITIEEDIAYQFRKCVSLGLHRKIGRRKLIPVIAYMTCRRLSIPRTLQDVADASNISKRVLCRNYSRIILELGVFPETIKPRSLIPRIATTMALAEKVSRFAIQIASEYEITRYSLGKNPSGVAGASASADCVAAKNCFSPNPMNVAPGTAVTWKNYDVVSHYVSSGLPSDSTTGTMFDSGNLIKPGGTFQFTFANPGTYNYFCTVHPWMVGQVIVGGAVSNAAVPEFGSVAPIVLAIAASSIVVFAAKTRVIPRF